MNPMSFMRNFFARREEEEVQKFYLPFSYLDPDTRAVSVADTWCKDYKQAIARVRGKVPSGCLLQEAYLVEWQNPDAPMEPIAGNVDKPNPKLLELLVDKRNGKLAPALEKAKRRAVNNRHKPRIRLKSTPPPPAVKKPEAFRPFTVYLAGQYRDRYWLKEK